MQIRITRIGRPALDDPRGATLLLGAGSGLGGGLLLGALIAAVGSRRRPSGPAGVRWVAVA